jgi:hypothetical protein
MLSFSLASVNALLGCVVCVLAVYAVLFVPDRIVCSDAELSHNLWKLCQLIARFFVKQIRLRVNKAEQFSRQYLCPVVRDVMEYSVDPSHLSSFKVASGLLNSEPENMIPFLYFEACCHPLVLESFLH